MTDPFRPSQQNWEELRQSVQDQNEEGGSIDRRVSLLEKKVGLLEVSLVRDLASLTAAYQHIAGAFDKLVTKDQFDVVKTQVNGLWICVAIFVIVYVFKR